MKILHALLPIVYTIRNVFVLQEYVLMLMIQQQLHIFDF